MMIFLFDENLHSLYIYKYIFNKAARHDVARSICGVEVGLAQIMAECQGVFLWDCRQKTGSVAPIDRKGTGCHENNNQKRRRLSMRIDRGGFRVPQTEKLCAKQGHKGNMFRNDTTPCMLLAQLHQLPNRRVLEDQTSCWNIRQENFTHENIAGISACVAANIFNEQNASDICRYAGSWMTSRRNYI